MSLISEICICEKVSLYFSQKLNSSQDINGLVTINGNTGGFTMKKQDHVLSIYPGEELEGNLHIELHGKIASTLNHELGKTVSIDVSLDDNKPALKLVGTGVITPGNEGVIFPFEAINRRAVEVEVLRIFDT